MTDFAKLVLAADTSQLVKGVTVLNAIVEAGGRAEQAVKSLGAAFQGVKGAASGAASAASSGAKSFNEVEASAIRSAAGVTTASTATKALSTATDTIVSANGPAAASMSVVTSEASRQAAAFDKLRSSLDPVFGAEQKLAAAQNQLSAAVSSGLVSQEQSNALLARASAQYDKATGATASLAQAQRQIDAAWKSATATLDAFARRQNAAADSFESLRASIDPAYASTVRYAQVQRELAGAISAGMISQSEGNSLLLLAQQRLDGVTHAVGRTAHGYGRLHGVNGLAAASTGNLAAQFNDIAVMLAAGQNPLQLALQQGTQITQVFGNAGAAGAMNILKGALLSLINPFNLMIIVGIAAGAALFQYFSGIKQGGDKAKKEVYSLVSALQTYDAAVETSMSTTDALKKKYGDFANEVERTEAVVVEAAKVLTLDNLGKDKDILFPELDSAAEKVATMEQALLNYTRAFAANRIDSAMFAKALDEASTFAIGAADSLDMTTDQVKTLDAAFDQLNKSATPIELRDNLQAVLDTFTALKAKGLVLTPDMSKMIGALEKARNQIAGTEADLDGSAKAAKALAKAIEDAKSSVEELASATGSLQVENIGKAAENAALLSGKSLEAAEIAGKLATKYAEMAPALNSMDASVRSGAAAELARYEAALLTGKALDDQKDGLVEQREALSGLVSDTARALEAIKSLPGVVDGVISSNIGKAAENAALLSGETDKSAAAAGLMAIKYAELAPALGSQISAISFVAQQEFIRYQNALRTGVALDEQAEAVRKMMEASKKQKDEAAEALVKAEALLNTKLQENEVARVSAAYGADSLQATQARQAAELQVLDAMLQTMPISDTMRANIISAAQAGYDLANAAAIAAGNISTAAGEAARLAANLGAAAAGASNMASRQLAIVGAQIAAVRAGQNELVAGKTKALELDKSALRTAQLNAGVDAGIVENMVRTTFQSQEQLIAAEATLVSAQKTRTELNRAGGSGGAGGISKGAKEAAKELKKTEKAAEELRKELSAPMVGAIDGVANAFGDFVSRGLQDFKGFVKSILGSFQQMISQMIAMAVKNRIIMSIGTAGGLFSADQVSAASAAVKFAGAGGGGGIGGIIGKVSNVLGAFTTGLTNSLGSLLSGGIGGMFSGIKAAMAGATSGLAGLAGAAGALLGPIGLVAAAFSFFKKKTELLNAGLRLTVTGMNALVESFQTIKTTKFWGLSKKTNTSYDSASAEIADPIVRAVSLLQNSIVDAADALGISESAFSSFAHTLTVDTKGLSEDEALKKLQEAIVGVGDAFASMIPGLNFLRKDGEGSSDALTRLVQSMNAVNQAADSLGLSFKAVGLSGANIASLLADAFGGLDTMVQAVDSYYKIFYSEAERTATAIRQSTAALTALGGTMPRTRDEYRAMVTAQNLNTEAGRKLFATLVGLSGVMDQVLPKVSSLTTELEALVGNAQTGLEAMISATESAQRDALTAAKAWYATAKTLREYIADLRGAVSELVSPAQARAFNEMRFQTLLASALSGNRDAADDLTGAADALIDSVMATARTGAEAAITQARILSDLQVAAGAAEIGGAAQDVIANLLTQQKELLTDILEYLSNGGVVTAADLTGLNAQLGSLQAAIVAAEGITYASLAARIDMTVDLIANANIPASLRTMLDNAADGITANLDFIVRAEGITPDIRWLALNAASEHLATVNFLVGAQLPVSLAGLALTASADLARTVNFVLGSTLNPDSMRLALAASSEMIRTVRGALGTIQPGSFALAMAQSSELTRTINAALNTSALSPTQLALLNAITGSSTGTITLGGSFVWDPSTGFQAWYEQATQAGIANPIVGLTIQMAQLRGTLDALVALMQAELDAKLAAERERALAPLRAAEAKLQGLSETRVGAVATLQSKVNAAIAFDQNTVGNMVYQGQATTPSVNAQGLLDYRIDDIWNSTIAANQIWRDQYLNTDNGIQQQMYVANHNIKAIDNELIAARAQVRALGGVPAFADGGNHAGGLRIVGEKGPELEATGASKIYSARQTKKMLEGEDEGGAMSILRKLEALCREVAMSRDQDRQLQTQIVNDIRKERRIHEDWDANGMPPVRT